MARYYLSIYKIFFLSGTLLSRPEKFQIFTVTLSWLCYLLTLTQSSEISQYVFAIVPVGLRHIIKQRFKFT